MGHCLSTSGWSAAHPGSSRANNATNLVPLDPPVPPQLLVRAKFSGPV